MVNKVGRPSGGGNARALLLNAAHRHFEAGDLAAISTRRLAAEVGVSHTLVNYHFGSRDGLLAVAVSLRAAPHQVIGAARDAEGRLDLARLVHGLVLVWEHPEHGARLASFARGLAAGDPRSSVLSSYLQHTVFESLAAQFGQDRARRMATAIIGVIFGRYVLELPVLTGLSAAGTATLLLSMLRQP
ncbi:TetR family transcriptional regulator [Microbacterium sp. YMB-B2]|uniref:TetR family transcriptional regulator n=1 Tax=Microbacterium tenebrionis TaxID=2830665 RepID=A0A9X1LMX6_9MICO|nr:TetR/AcrR family transcriptional regulator [Microbacterium tenebrionis]MCC2028621.1 TetR family transcriptional regulator [Microbacterium tenebrionis]